MPETISVNNNMFADYIKVASLPRSERVTAFGKLSNEKKANFFKVHFALQFVKRPNMTKEQKDFILESISKISADLYDKQNFQKVALSNQINQEAENKIFELFPRKDALEILEGLGTNKDEEVSLLQKYEDLLMNATKMRMKITKEMPVNDRINIWKVQLAYHLATGKFSNSQNEFILEMMASLSPKTFTTQTYLTKEEKVKEGELLLSPIFRVFNKEEGYAIFMTLGIQKYLEDESVGTATLNSTTCNCLISCDLQGYVCGSENGCVSTTDGCGVWGILGCHYLCVRGTID